MQLQQAFDSLSPKARVGMWRWWRDLAVTQDGRRELATPRLSWAEADMRELERMRSAAGWGRRRSAAGWGGGGHGARRGARPGGAEADVRALEYLPI